MTIEEAIGKEAKRLKDWVAKSKERAIEVGDFYSGIHTRSQVEILLFSYERILKDIEND